MAQPNLKSELKALTWVHSESFYDKNLQKVPARSSRVVHVSHSTFSSASRPGRDRFEDSPHNRLDCSKSWLETNYYRPKRKVSAAEESPFRLPFIKATQRSSNRPLAMWGYQTLPKLREIVQRSSGPVSSFTGIARAPFIFNLLSWVLQAWPCWWLSAHTAWPVRCTRTIYFIRFQRGSFPPGHYCVAAHLQLSLAVLQAVAVNFKNWIRRLQMISNKFGGRNAEECSPVESLRQRQSYCPVIGRSQS